MSGRKHVFKMVPGEELSKGFGSSVYWPDFSRFQSVKTVRLVQLGKEDEVVELPIRLYGDNIARGGFYCIRNEEDNNLKGTFSRDKPGYSENGCTFIYYDDMLVKLSMESKFIEREQMAVVLCVIMLNLRDLNTVMPHRKSWMILTNIISQIIKEILLIHLTIRYYNTLDWMSVKKQ